MRSTRLKVFPSILLALLLPACADNRESIAHEHLQQQITAQSGGALTLSSFSKTNGYDQETGGMKLYTLEWEARLAVQADTWKAGWSDFGVLGAPPSALESAVTGVTPRQLKKGSTVVLLGQSKLQKAERGWRVLSSNVTASKFESAREEPSIQQPIPTIGAERSASRGSNVTASKSESAVEEPRIQQPAPTTGTERRATQGPSASVNVTAFSSIPPFIVGCCSIFSESKSKFVAKKYVYADDLGTQCLIVVGKTPIVLKKVETNDPSVFSEYANDEYTATIKIERSLGNERENETVVGKLIVKHKDGSIVTKAIYGTRGC